VDSFNGRVGPVALSAVDVTDALGFTPAHNDTQAFSGAVSAASLAATGFVTGKGFSPNALGFTAVANQALDYNAGQSQVIALTVPTAFTFTNLPPPGAIWRLTLLGTSNAVTWPVTPTINWPLGAAPNLALGPLKKAVVVLEYDGTALLATASAY
jgi:hypothetical protein